MFLATNAICGMRHTRQTQKSTIAQMMKGNLLIAFMSVVAACSGVPLIPGIYTFPSFSFDSPEI